MELLKVIPHKPRWLNKGIAKIFGYFWSICPICGEPFAGYEWSLNNTIYYAGGEGKCVCYKKECGNKAREMSMYG